MRYDEKLRAHGPILWLLVSLGVLDFVSTVPSAFHGALDVSASTAERLGAVAGGLLGVVTAVWLVWMHIRVKVSDSMLSASFFPLIRRRIPLNDIRSAQRVKVSALAKYGGWGIKGWGRNLLLGLSGNEGVQIDYGNNRRLVILTQDPEPLVRAIGKAPAREPARA